MQYSVILEDEANARFQALDGSVKVRIAKKLEQLEREDLKSRHFERGVPVFVEEVGAVQDCLQAAR